MEQYITIKTAKERTGVSDHTLRYYEKVGLLPDIGRLPNGHRVFTERDIEWVNILKLLRSTGMSIEHMLHLVKLRTQGDASLEKRIEYFRVYQQELHEQIAVRQAAIATIEQKIIRHQEKLSARKAKE